MAKFKCIEVYTPDNPKLTRDRDDVEFRCDSKDPLEIAKVVMAEFCGSSDEFFEQHKGTIKDCLDNQAWCEDGENNFEFTIRTNDGEFYYEIQQLPPSPETPVTDENIVAWVEKRVALSPTWEDKRDDKTVTKANTVERELGLILFKNSMESFEEYTKGDLLEYISDLIWVGTKGYEEMSLKELLEEVNGVIVQRVIDDSGDDEVFMEDLPYFNM